MVLVANCESGHFKSHKRPPDRDLLTAIGRQPKMPESRFVHGDWKHIDGDRTLIYCRPSEETRLRRPNHQFVDSHLRGMQGRPNHDLLPQSRCLTDHEKTNASACITFSQKQWDRKLTAAEARFVNCHWHKNPMAISLLV